MNWVSLACLSLLANSGMVISWQRLGKSYSPQVYLFHTWLIIALSLLLTNFYYSFSFPKLNLWIILLFLLAGISSWAGNYFYSIAIKYQSNLGYVEAFTSIRVGITYVVSVVWLQDPFQILKLVGVFFCIVGLIIISAPNGIKHENHLGYKWIISSIIAGVMFSSLILINRYINTMGISSSVSLSLWGSMVALLYLGNSIISKQNFIPLKKDLLLIALSGILGLVGNVALFKSYEFTPNLAYTSSISNSRLVILWVISILVGYKKFEKQKLLGILLSFSGILLLI